jgi:membrane protease YdiL (CAAX protease family)
MPEPEGPRPIFLPAPDGIFPGPFAAVLLTLGGYMTTSIMFAALYEPMHVIAAFGIAQVIGLGGVAALAARRVPPPHVERIGLRGFRPALIVPLVCLLPVVVVVSEFDNIVRLMLPPPPPEMAEAVERLAELTKIDSMYAAIQTTIVAVGISPVVEGFFFFGVLLQGLIARMGRVRGALLTAVLYSITHFPASGASSEAIVASASGLVVGSLLALARMASGSVLAAMGLAAAFAAIHIAASEGSDYLAIAGFNAPGDHTSALIVVPCAAAVLYGTWILWSRAAVADINPPIPESALQEEEEEDGGFFF